MTKTMAGVGVPGKAEKELLVQNAYLEILFNTAPEAIVLHNNDDRVVNVNDEFTRVFGYTREEAIGKPLDRLVASPDFATKPRWFRRRC